MMNAKKPSLVPRIGVASLCSPLEVGADCGRQAAADAAKLFQGFGCQVVELGVIDRPDKSSAAGRKLAESHVHAVVFIATSWFEDYLVFDLLEECAVPPLFWSLPGMETGALCGVQQLTACLKPWGIPYYSVFGTLESADCRVQAKQFLMAAALAYRLRRMRIGLAGYPANGMGDIVFNPCILRKVLGPRIVSLDVPRLLEAAQAVPDRQVESHWREVVRRTGKCSISETDGLEAMKTLVAVRQLVDEHGLDALAVGCYPHLMGRVCLVASLLADEGIPLACEGDVHGAIGQWMLTLLTGEPTHNTDWLDPLDDDTVVFSHCGAGSFSLAERPNEILLAPVRLVNQGVCALFCAKPGPVTLVNILAQENKYQIAVLEGQAVSTPMVFPGNPLRVGFCRPVAEIMEWISDQGIGHHWMVGYGHLGNALHQWTKIAGPNVQLVATA
jgi:L-fucose isomerase-like protein